MNTLTVVMLVAMAAFLFVRSRGAGASEVLEALDEGAIVVDVRTPREFSGGRVDGALNIPVDQLTAHLEQLRGFERPIVVYCASGMRSARAASLLNSQGIPAINAGSLAAWPRPGQRV